jgi:hypothetical protein
VPFQERMKFWVKKGSFVTFTFDLYDPATIQKLGLVHDTEVTWLSCEEEVDKDAAASSDQELPFQVRIRLCSEEPDDVAK